MVLRAALLDDAAVPCACVGVPYLHAVSNGARPAIIHSYTAIYTADDAYYNRETNKNRKSGTLTDHMTACIHALLYRERK